MTKDEIAQNNLEIARLVYPDHKVAESNNDGAAMIMLFDIVSGQISGMTTTILVDYYNNWSDLMPLVEELNIESVKMSRGLIWGAKSADMDTWATPNSSLRHALANCLLEVLRRKAKEKIDE